MEQSNIISGSDAERCGLSVVNPDTGLISNQEQCAIMLASGVSITEGGWEALLFSASSIQ